LKRAALVFLIATTAVLGAAAPANAAPMEIDSYCSSTGDFCQGLYRTDGKVRAKLTTFSFRGNIQLCVSGPMPRDCKKFRLRGDGDIFTSSVGLAKHFALDASGRYAVTWRYRGSRIGMKLHFNKKNEGPATAG